MTMYFVAIVLPKEIDDKILLYKKQMQEKYGCKVGLKSPAHITIVPPFWMDPAKEGQLIHDLDSIASTNNHFPVATNNFSAFKPRTLFIDVIENAKLRNLKKASDQFFRNTAYGIKIDSRAFHPHITIATRDLLKKDFAEVWPTFEHKIFQEQFEANGLSLLRHNGRVWDVVHTSAFAA